MKTTRIALFAAALPLAALAQQVKAPPRPPGSHLVRVAPGLNPVEEKRSIRAHHHKGHVGKDVTADDSANGGRAIPKNGGRK
jgi:hypothetical protein